MEPMNLYFRVTPSRAERLRLLRRMLRTTDQAVKKVLERGDLRPCTELDQALRDIEVMLWVMRVTGDYDDGDPFLTDRWLSRLASRELRYQRPYDWWERKADAHNFPYDYELAEHAAGEEWNDDLWREPSTDEPKREGE